MNVTAPISRPTYTTTKGVDYAQWLADNEDELKSWYEATTEWAQQEHYADWREFCAVQFDLACEDDARLTDGLYEAALQDTDNDDEPLEDAR